MLPHKLEVAIRNLIFKLFNVKTSWELSISLKIKVD